MCWSRTKKCMAVNSRIRQQEFGQSQSHPAQRQRQDGQDLIPAVGNEDCLPHCQDLPDILEGDALIFKGETAQADCKHSSS